MLWIALIWFAPIFGVLFYLVFGINRIDRRSKSIHKPARIPIEGSLQIQNDCHASDPWRELENLGDRISEFQRTGHNSVETLIGLEKAQLTMIDAIDQARTQVWLATYIFRKDKIGMMMAAALCRAQERGVDVKVLIDGVGGGVFSSMYHELRKRKIVARRFLHSIWPWKMTYLNLRNHRKLLIVDGFEVFTGSLNIGWAENLETHFRLRGPIATQCAISFTNDWVTSGGEDIKIGENNISGNGPGKVQCRNLPSGPIYRMERLRWMLIGAIGTASKSIKIVSPYFIPDRGLISALILAALRGVSVEIVLPQKSNYRFADWGSRFQIRDLLAVGCKIYHTAEYFDHSKLFTIDDKWALIGSSNWDARSIRLNFELDVECVNKQFVEELNSVIDARIAVSEPETYHNMMNAPLFYRLRDATARLLLPFL